MNRQKPFTTNQISNTKPNVPKSEVMITGHVANSVNGGMIKPIAYQKVMAGQKVRQYNLQAKFHLLTPLTPAYQKLKATIYSYFVPNSRVWENAEKFTAQNGPISVEKVKEIPNLGNLSIPFAYTQGALGAISTPPLINLSNTSVWRDSYISTYIPRMGVNKVINEGGSGPENLRDQYLLPRYNALPLRGFRAIYNDMLRNKEYEAEQQEYKNDTVSNEEWQSYLPLPGNLKNCIIRGRRQNSYYTDYRTELQGIETEEPDISDATQALTDWLAWENLISEARSQAEDAQANPWDIIAKIRGSKKLTEGKVQLIGKKTFDLNYSAITQSTYNNNENVNEEFRVMGKQGAYSYTEINLPCYAGMIFNEEGFVHFLIQVSADTVFESGFDRQMLNVDWDSEYRPDLLEQKDDVLYDIEMSTNNITNLTTKALTSIAGFKRKYSEIFKLPNIIAGDMTTLDYWEVENETTTGPNGTTFKTTTEEPNIITQKTYQFYESGDQIAWLSNEMFATNARIYKQRWKDYTDLALNKNQAIMNEIIGTDDRTEAVRIGGQNQIFFAGITFCETELPVDSSIIGNYTTWGEH